jgi:putative ABC transport system permease protein
MTGRTTLAFRYLWRQKMRTGFVVATFTAAVTVTLLLTSAIVGTEQTFIGEINALGVTWIYVEPGTSNSASIYPLTVGDAQAIARSVPHLAAVAPIMIDGLSVDLPAWGKSLADITGTNASVQSIFKYSVTTGSFALAWGGNLSAPLPVVAGYNVWTTHDLSVGQVLPATIVSLSASGGGGATQVNLVVAGLLGARGSLGGTDLDSAIFTPISALENLTNSISLTYIFVSASSSEYVGGVTSAITSVVQQRHQGYQDFTVLSEQSWVSYVHDQLAQFSSIISLVEATLLMLSSMSVFVVMTMAVRDRRRVIGAMRAIGAHRSDIMGQFLLEASLMSVSGIGIGVILGTAVAGYLKANAGGFYSYLLTNPVQLGPYFYELLGVLWGIGFLFSMVPAYQASRLEAVEALTEL